MVEVPQRKKKRGLSFAFLYYSWAIPHTLNLHVLLSVHLLTIRLRREVKSYTWYAHAATGHCRNVSMEASLRQIYYNWTNYRMSKPTNEWMYTSTWMNGRKKKGNATKNASYCTRVYRLHISGYVATAIANSNAVIKERLRDQRALLWCVEARANYSWNATDWG